MQPDTRKLLRTGLTITGIGIIAATLMVTAFGGIVRHQGPHTNLGWLSLMLAIGCLPTGCLTLLLATVKLIGDHRREH
jgi:hypothetical protein